MQTRMKNRITACGMATAMLTAAIIAPVATAAQEDSNAQQRQTDKNNNRNLGVGLGSAAVIEALRGKGTNALLLGAGAAYAGKKYNDAKKAQEKENQQRQRATQATPPPMGNEFGRASSAMMAGSDINVLVNEQKVSFADQKPQVVAGRVYVPMRGVLEKMGANVQWNERERAIVAMHGDKTVMLPAQGQAMVNGRPVATDAPAFIENGRTMVPLRFMAETFGAQVNWDPQDREVNINSRATTAMNN